VRPSLSALGVVLIIAAAAPGPVAAASPSPARPAGPPERILGMVQVHGQAKHARPSRTSNLTYHGGPVMHGNRVYTIFWGSGPWDAGYKTTINDYFGDVAADSGASTNVYDSDTQYGDGSGPIAYDVSVGGTWDDASAYPGNGCTDKATKICLSDAQLQGEVKAAMAANGWTAVGPGGIQNLFFVFTPKGVGSCAGSSCAYTTYCAYHSWMGSGSNAILYANQPYAVQNYRIYTCDSGQRPNGVTADATINLISHEHNEAITDEQGSAWFDSQGAENGDKCAWNFGATSGPSGARYNQTINGRHYYLQQEWSNASPGCVLQGT
jgi:hypothetical protein